MITYPAPYPGVFMDMYNQQQVPTRFSCRFDILNMTAIVGITFVFWDIHLRVSRKGKGVISACSGARYRTIMAYNLDIFSQSGAPLIRVIEGFIKYMARRSFILW